MTGVSLHPFMCIYEEKVHFWNQWLSIQYGKWLMRKRSHWRWWTVIQPPVFKEYLTEPICHEWGYGVLSAVTVFIHFISRLFKLSSGRLPCIIEFCDCIIQNYQLIPQILFIGKMFTRDGLMNYKNSHSWGLEMKQMRLITVWDYWQWTYLTIHVWMPHNGREAPKLPWRLPARTTGRCAAWG